MKNTLFSKYHLDITMTKAEIKHNMAIFYNRYKWRLRHTDFFGSAPRKDNCSL